MTHASRECRNQGSAKLKVQSGWQKIIALSFIKCDFWVILGQLLGDRLMRFKITMIHFFNDEIHRVK